MDPTMCSRRKEIRERIIDCNENLSLSALIKADKNRYPTIGEALTSPGFWIVVSYRLAHWLSHHHLDLLGKFLQLLIYLIFNCDISRRASFGPGIGLFHPMGIFVGAMVAIGKCCDIGPHVFIGANREPNDPDDYPVLGNYVILGSSAQVYGGILVGNGVRIGPGAILFKDVPDGHNIVSPSTRTFKREDWDYEKFGKKNW